MQVKRAARRQVEDVISNDHRVLHLRHVAALAGLLAVETAIKPLMEGSLLGKISSGCVSAQISRLGKQRMARSTNLAAAHMHTMRRNKPHIQLHRADQRVYKGA